MPRATKKPQQHWSCEAASIVDWKEIPGQRWIKLVPFRRNNASNTQMVRLGNAHGDHPGGLPCSVVVDRNWESAWLKAGRESCGTRAAVSRMPQFWYADCAMPGWEATLLEATAGVADCYGGCSARGKGV